MSTSRPDPFGWFSTLCRCADCDPARSSEWLCETVEDMAALGVAMTVEREELALKAQDHLDRGSLPFDPEELLLTSALTSAFAAKATPFQIAFEQALDNFGFNLNRINDVINDHRPEFEKTFDAVEPEVVRLVGTTISTGEAQIAADLLRGAPSRQIVHDGIVRATRYYTNNFFNTQIVPEIHGMIDGFLNDPANTFATPDLTPLRTMLDKRLKSVPYWNVVANAAASRGFHYGYLKAAQMSGMLSYIIIAVLDRRTSELCRHLDGRVFWVADAVKMLEIVNADEDPEAAKKLMPWRKLDEVKDMDNDALIRAGVLVPPFHGRCRTTLLPG